jgi:hypothetical protein
MKSNAQLLGMMAGLAVAAGWISPSAAAPAQPNEAKAPRSVFTLPVNPKEGRDPFFPNSTRVYEAAVVGRTAGLVSLVLKGFSASPDHRIVVINNHSFAAGDEGVVITSDGRIRIRCVEIKEHSVVVEANGQRQELIIQNN